MFIICDSDFQACGIRFKILQSLLLNRHPDRNNLLGSVLPFQFLMSRYDIKHSFPTFWRLLFFLNLAVFLKCNPKLQLNSLKNYIRAKNRPRVVQHYIIFIIALADPCIKGHHTSKWCHCSSLS